MITTLTLPPIARQKSVQSSKNEDQALSFPILSTLCACKTFRRRSHSSNNESLKGRKGFGSGLPLEFVKKIGIKDVTTQVCIAMTQYTKDPKQEVLSSFSSNKVVVGFKD